MRSSNVIHRRQQLFTSNWNFSVGTINILNGFIFSTTLSHNRCSLFNRRMHPTISNGLRTLGSPERRLSLPVLVWVVHRRITHWCKVNSSSKVRFVSANNRRSVVHSFDPINTYSIRIRFSNRSIRGTPTNMLVSLKRRWMTRRSSIRSISVHNQNRRTNNGRTFTIHSSVTVFPLVYRRCPVRIPREMSNRNQPSINMNTSVLRRRYPWINTCLRHRPRPRLSATFISHPTSNARWPAPVDRVWIRHCIIRTVRWNRRWSPRWRWSNILRRRYPRRYNPIWICIRNQWTINKTSRRHHRIHRRQILWMLSKRFFIDSKTAMDPHLCLRKARRLRWTTPRFLPHHC